MGSTEVFQTDPGLEDTGLSDHQMETNPFPDSTHTLIGIYLVVVGLIGTFGNGLVLAMFLRFRNLLTPTAVLLVNLAIADLGVLLFGFPFSASSSFAKTWLFGEGGCQWYAFVGFLFGTAHIGTLALLAVDRYRVTTGAELTYARYCKQSFLIWLFAAFWAAMPLFGWASYKSFMVSYFALGYAVPLAVIVFSYSAIARRMKSDETPAIRSELKEKWANEKNVTVMSFTVVVAFLVAWTPYAVLCVWTVFAEPSTVPAFLTLLPPLCAKGSLTFNPIIYYATNPRLRQGLVATLTRCRDNPGETVEMSAEKEPVNPNDAKRDDDD